MEFELLVGELIVVFDEEGYFVFVIGYVMKVRK